MIASKPQVAPPHAALLSTIRPYAVALGLPVTMEGLAARLDQDGARRVATPDATADNPAFLIGSLPELLRIAVQDGSPEILALLRSRTLSLAGIARAARFRAVIYGNSSSLIHAAEAVRMTVEDLMAMLLNGDAITIRVAEEIAANFSIDLDWLLGRDLSDGARRH